MDTIHTDTKTTRDFEIEVTDEMVNEFLNSLDKKKEREDATLSKTYLDWLASYLAKSEDHSISDDDFLYGEDGEDKKNSMELSYLFGALLRKNIPSIEDEDGDFPNCVAYFSYKGKTYKIETIIGQGSVTIVTLCDDNEYDIPFEIDKLLKSA